MSVFIIEHVYKSYIVNKNEHVVLKDINLTLPDSGLVSIVGKSGSGKSTLLNILMGIERPSKGKVFFEHKNIFKYRDSKFSNYHLSGVSLIFQHYNLFDNLTALENAILPLQMKGESNKKAKEKALEYFKKFNIENVMNNKASKLSGGEKQRVAIIRSLLVSSRAILCDEPTGALDEKNSREIMKILKSISERILVVMVSHNRQLVNQFSDQILILKDGMVVDNISTVKKHFSNRFEKKKFKYNSSWSNRFFKNNIKKDLSKNIFSIIACLISFTSVFLSIGFISGSSESQNEALDKNLSTYFSTVSKSEFITLEGSPLTYQKTMRPSLYQLDEKLSDFSTLKVEENISYLISSFSSCTYNKKPVSNYEMVPYFKNELYEEDKSLLVDGSSELNELTDLIVNTDFASLIGGDVINKEIVISNNAPITYNTGDSNNPFIRDSLYYSMKFRIVGVVKEFSFLNTPKIYYSYYAAKNFLKHEVMENLSNHFNKPISYFSYLENCASDDPVCSYSYFLYLDGRDETQNFYKKIKDLEENNDEIQITSQAAQIKETYNIFISSFSSTLFVFVIITFIGINFILGMISLSTFISNRKDTAIMTCLGARNASIYNLYLSENYLIVFISFLLSIFLSIFLQTKLNEILYSKFILNNLINMPINSFLGIPFGLPILLFVIFIFFSTIFTQVPMSIYRNKSLSDELRDE